MLSTFRRVLSRPGIFSIARRLPTRAILSNQSFAIAVQRNFTATSDRNSDSTADSKPEPESKPKSTRRKTGSSPKTAGTDKKKKKKKVAKKRVAKKKAVKKKAVTKRKVKPEELPPRPPANSYAQWLRDWISTQPKIESMEEAQVIVKKGAQIWNTLPEHEKQQYREKAHALWDEHHSRMEEWRDKVDLAVVRELNRRRVAKGHNRLRGPRRPATGYIRYFMSLRDEYPRTEGDYRTYFKALTGRASSQWKAMSDSEKAEYNAPAETDLTAWNEKYGIKPKRRARRFDLES